MSDVKDAPPKKPADKPAASQLPGLADKPAEAAPLAPEAAAAKPAEKRAVRPLPLSLLTKINVSEGNFGTVWGATVPNGTTLDDLQDESFWSSTCADFREYDEIRVRDQGRNFYAEFLIRSVRTVGSSLRPNRASVQLLRFYELNPVDSGIDLSGFENRWLGNGRKWGVVRTADGMVISEGFASPEDVQRARVLAAMAAQNKQPQRAA